MAKVKSTASEVQLKARRTSLGKKTNDELINIILRKDKSERSMNSRIQELTALLKEADELNDEKANRILGFEKDMNGMKEEIDKIISDKINLRNEYNICYKEVIRLKKVCNFRRKAILTCFGIIAILLIFIVLSF